MSSSSSSKLPTTGSDEPTDLWSAFTGAPEAGPSSVPAKASSSKAKAPKETSSKTLAESSTYVCYMSHAANHPLRSLNLSVQNQMLSKVISSLQIKEEVKTVTDSKLLERKLESQKGLVDILKSLKKEPGVTNVILVASVSVLADSLSGVRTILDLLGDRGSIQVVDLTGKEPTAVQLLLAYALANEYLISSLVRESKILMENCAGVHPDGGASASSFVQLTDGTQLQLSFRR